MSDVNVAEVKAGRGQKVCPTCGVVVGAARKVCACGHVFIEREAAAGNRLAVQLRRAAAVQDIPTGDLEVVLRHLNTIAELGGVQAFRSVADAVIASRS